MGETQVWHSPTLPLSTSQPALVPLQDLTVVFQNRPASGSGVCGCACVRGLALPVELETCQYLGLTTEHWCDAVSSQFGKMQVTPGRAPTPACGLWRHAGVMVRLPTGCLGLVPPRVKVSVSPTAVLKLQVLHPPPPVTDSGRSNDMSFYCF